MQTAERFQEVARKLLCEYVNEYGPCRAVQAVMHVTGEIAQGKHGAFNIPANNMADGMNQTIEEAVKDGSIVELEYILPDMNYRIKSMLFPKGTALQIGTGRT